MRFNLRMTAKSWFLFTSVESETDFWLTKNRKRDNTPTLNDLSWSELKKSANK